MGSQRVHHEKKGELVKNVLNEKPHSRRPITLHK